MGGKVGKLCAIVMMLLVMAVVWFVVVLARTITIHSLTFENI